MKKFLVIFIFLPLLANAQVNNIIAGESAAGKEWIRPGAEHMRITADSAFLKFPFQSQTSFARFRDSMLTFTTTRYTYSPAREPHISVDSFKAELYNNDTLVLRAVNKNAFELARTWSPDTFYKVPYIHGAPFSFQKLYFRRSGSGMVVGNYSNVEFEVDSSGAILFSCVKGKGQYNGTYNGHLTSSQLEELTGSVKNCNPDKFAISPEHWSDAPGYGFKFYCNNTLRDAWGQMLPDAGRQLATLMESLIDKVSWEKMSDKFGLKNR